MANLTSTLTVRLLDQVSAPAGKAAKALLGIGEASAKANKLGLGDRLQGALDRNNRALNRVRGQMVDAVGAVYVLKRALTGAVAPAISFESALADIAKVSNFDDAGLDAYGRRLRQLATTEIPLAVTELAALSAAAAQSGVAEIDLFDFTRITAKAAVAWDVTGAAAGEALAKIQTQLSLTVDQTALFADAINHLSNNTASSAPDLIDYSRRVAAQGEFFGYAATETLAFGAAMVAAGAQSEVAATSFRNMGRALTKGASAPKRMRAAFRQIGLDPEAVAKNMQTDAMGTTLDVMERLRALPAHMQASVMSDLFGDEARALAPLLNDLDILRKVLGLVGDETAYAGSVTEEFEKRARTTEYAIQRFKNQVVDIGIAIGNSLMPPLRQAMNLLGPIAGHVTALAERFPALTRAVVLATGGLIAFRVALIGVKWAALMARGGLLSMLLPFARMADAAKGAVALQGALAGMSGISFGPMAKAAAALSGMARSIPIIGGLLVGGVSAPVVAGLAAIAAVGGLIYKYWDRLSSIFSGVGRAIGEQLAPALEYARPVLDFLAPVGDLIAAGWEKASAALQAFTGWIGSFFSREVLSEDQKAQWEQAGHEAATRMIEAIKAAFAGLVSWAAGLGRRVGSAIGGAASGAINSVKSWWTGDAGGGAASAAPVEARAAGGPVRRGRAYLVGEEGPELAIFGGNGRIVPHGETMAMLQARGSAKPAAASAGATVTVNAPITINGVSDAQEAARAVVRALNNQLGPAIRGTHADIGIA